MKALSISECLLNLCFEFNRTSPLVVLMYDFGAHPYGFGSFILHQFFLGLFNLQLQLKVPFYVNSGDFYENSS